MVQNCTKCARANPAEAVYCYYDGMLLDGRGGAGGPVQVGARAFAHPFVFPNGRACRSFNELALACQEDWATAVELLHQGYLESFLGGVGRMDLSLAAKEAARFPDRDRGLDQLLAKFPSPVLLEPKLRLDPLEVNLGVLQVGTDRAFELNLENQGMRLLYGSVSSSDVWLTLGELPGAAEKHVQFTHECTLPAHVRGDRLRAGKKPLEARLLVDSNGGQQTVTVRAEVPIIAFPAGALEGAKSPREVAEKCLAHPKETAPLFERGEVANWYASNGWTYPVKIPAASGVAAVQQFFEALGVTKAPKVSINVSEWKLKGKVGESLQQELEFSSQEKRAVYAHGTSDSPWLEVGRTRFNGKVVTILLVIPAIPNRPGETLKAKVKVLSNGNQRFVVPVTLQVAGSPISKGGAFDFGSPAQMPPPEVGVAAGKEVESAPRRGRRPVSKKRVRWWAHALPAILLVLCVLGVVAADRAWRTGPDAGSGAFGNEDGWQVDYSGLKDKKPVLGLNFNDDSRFGIVMMGVKDPRPEYRNQRKRLTAHENGRSNNTVVFIEDSAYKFGFTTPTNKWYGVKLRELKKPRIGWLSTMRFTAQQIQVTQHVEIVPGQIGLLDTCLVRYIIKNYGTRPHKVGLRVMIDSYIGANDGVPFLVPGQKGLVTKKEDFDGNKIPDYIEAIENPDNPTDMGTTVRMGLRDIQLPDDISLEEPDRLRICGFPGADAGWDWTPEDMDKDSCVAIYWKQRELEPGAMRQMAFTYGLSKLEVGDALALSSPSSVLPGREFVMTAYIWNAKKGQKVTLVLPQEGVRLADGESAEKVIEDNAARTQIYWKLKAGKTEGTFDVGAVSAKAKAKPRPIQIKKTSIFG
jgi:hypothetical protein